MNKAWIYAIGLTAACLTSPSWSQSASGTDASSGSDPFVAQRNAIHRANQAYQKQVGVAQHEFDRVETAADQEFKKAVAKARTERNKEIAKIKAAG